MIMDLLCLVSLLSTIFCILFNLSDYFDTPIFQNESGDKVITNDDVLGDAVPYDQQEALRVLCYRLLDMSLVSIIVPTL